MRCESDSLTLTRVGEDHSKEKAIRGDLIKHVDWITCGRLATIQLYTKSNELYVVSRLEASQEDEICGYFRESLGVEPLVQHASVRGNVDGDLNLGECSFSISDGGHPVITVPYSKIHQVQAPSGRGLILNLNRDKKRESLTSLRLVVPKEYEKNSKDLRADIESRVVDLTAGTEDFIALVDKVKFVRPRLELNMRFCRDLVLLSNDDVAHRLVYEDIECVYRLERPVDDEDDRRSEFLVIAMKEMPLRHGQTSYMHIVIEASAENGASGKGLDDSLTEADQLGALFERFDVKVISDRFYKTPTDEKGIRCTFKTKHGYLYLTADSFLYVHHPVVLIKYRDVARVAFEKVSELHKHGKTFDLSVDKMDKGQKKVFKDIDMVTGMQIPYLDDDDADRMETIEGMKRMKRVEGIRSLIKWLQDKKVRIDGLETLLEEIRLLESSRSGRAAKLDAERRAREQDQQDDSETSTESDADFDPNAKKEEEDSSESEDEDEGDNDDAGSGSGSGSQAEAESSD